MVVTKKTFFTNQSSTGDSEELKNINVGSSLTLEVTGTATSKQLTVKGIVGDYNTSAWTTLAVINMTSFDTADKITANGIYSIGVDGVVRIKVVVDSISGGNVSVVGKVSN